MQITVLQELVRHSPLGSEEMFGRLDQWLQVAPFDLHPHEIMLDALAQRGRLHDAQEHLAKTIQLFDEEGIDTSSLRDTWRSVRRGTRRSSIPAAAQVVSQLVGRDAEWARLSKMWTKASEGRASFLLLTGAAGIGKTRLAEAFAASEAAKGAATARATCYVADRPMAYAAVADWLRSPAVRPVLDALPVSQLSQLARVMPGILLDRPDVPPPPPFTESWQRAHFFEALARALLAAPAPLLAFIDDVQWCDPETIEWLRYVMHFDPLARVMVIATARTGDVATEHAVAGMLRDLRRDERGAEIALGPLSADDIASLAAKIAAGLPEPRERVLYEKTRGNPLFIVEFVRAGLNDGDGDAVPPKVQAVIRTRFSQLGATTREMATRRERRSPPAKRWHAPKPCRTPSASRSRWRTTRCSSSFAATPS